MPLTTLATPKMVVSQFNSINITCVLRPLAKILLKVLMSWIADRHYNRWMSIFYATFIILREVAHTTLDAYQHGARNPDHDIDGPMVCLQPVASFSPLSRLTHLDGLPKMVS